MTIKRLEWSVLEYAINYITECPSGTFGNNCRQECGYCLEKYHCHHINGSCLDRCLQGFRGEQCKHSKCFQFNMFYLNKRLMSHIAHMNNGFSYHSISVFWYFHIYFNIILWILLELKYQYFFKTIFTILTPISINNPKWCFVNNYHDYL